MNQKPEFENRLKRLLEEGKNTSGAWSMIPSPIISEILSRADFDWLIVDMEHGPFDIGSLINQLQSIKGSNCVPIVRVPWNDLVIIKRVLDAGAYGVIVPYVNTKSEAEAAVRACKYPPDGIRGIAGSTRAAWYNIKAMEYFTSANKEILVITQVETNEAIENLDEILEVEGIDVIFIGPMDLSTNMGYLYNPSAEEVQSKIRIVEEKVKKSNKYLATIAKDFDQAKMLYDRGYQMVTLTADGSALAAIANQKALEFRQAFPEG